MVMAVDPVRAVEGVEFDLLPVVPRADPPREAELYPREYLNVEFDYASALREAYSSSTAVPFCREWLRYLGWAAANPGQPVAAFILTNVFRLRGVGEPERDDFDLNFSAVIGRVPARLPPDVAAVVKAAIRRAAACESAFRQAVAAEDVEDFLSRVFLSRAPYGRAAETLLSGVVLVNTRQHPATGAPHRAALAVTLLGEFRKWLVRRRGGGYSTPIPPRARAEGGEGGVALLDRRLRDMSGMSARQAAYVLHWVAGGPLDLATYDAVAPPLMGGGGVGAPRWRRCAMMRETDLPRRAPQG